MSAQTNWWSKRGTPLTPSVIERVNLDLLAQMYAAEESSEAMPPVDSATFHAWQLGYKNPRVPDPGPQGWTKEDTRV